MATIDTDLLDALTAANVPADKARAAAAAIERRIAENTVTNLDLGAVADRLETKIETEIGRLEAKRSSEVGRLEARIDRLDDRLSSVERNIGDRIEAAMWRHTGWTIAILIGAMGLLIKFVR